MSRERLRLLAALAPVLALGAFLLLARDLLGQETAKAWWWLGVPLWDYRAPMRQVIAAMIVLWPAIVLVQDEASITRFLARLSSARDWCRARIGPFAAVTLIGALLWVFRHTDLRYGDATLYATQTVPREAFSVRGVFVRYDEMLSYGLGTLGYRYARGWFELDPITWYNLFGLAFTGGFLGWLWRRRHRGALLGGGAVLAALLLGNYTQTMMGPVEHYGQMTALMVAFAILSVEALRGDEPLWKPCAAYSCACAFHLLPGWLFFALAFVVVSRWRSESRDGRTAAVVALALPAFLAVSLVHYWGFDLHYFFDSHGAQVKLVPFVDPRDPYIADVIQYTGVFHPMRLAHLLNVVVLMGWPGLLAMAASLPFLPRAWWSRAEVRFAFVFLASCIAFLMLWNNELPMVIDQDLFGFAGLGFCLVGALALHERLRALSAEDAARLVLGILGSALLYRVCVLLHHSVFSPSYAEPWIGISGR